MISCDSHESDGVWHGLTTEARPWWGAGTNFFGFRLSPVKLHGDSNPGYVWWWGYTPNSIHLVGIMISKTIGCRGTLFSKPFQRSGNLTEILGDWSWMVCLPTTKQISSKEALRNGMKWSFWMILILTVQQLQNSGPLLLLEIRHVFYCFFIRMQNLKILKALVRVTWQHLNLQPKMHSFRQSSGGRGLSTQVIQGPFTKRRHGRFSCDALLRFSTACVRYPHVWICQTLFLIDYFYTYIRDNYLTQSCAHQL